MEKLLELARAQCDQAEVFATSGVNDRVTFADAKINNIEASRLSGVSLRVIRDGKLGTAWTRNLDDPAGLVSNALASLAGGVAAGYELPTTTDLPVLDTAADAIDDLTTEGVVSECDRVAKRISEGTGGEVWVAGSKVRQKVRVLNTHGTDLSASTTGFWIGGGVRMPALSAGCVRMHHGHVFSPMPDEKLDEILAFYAAMADPVDVPSGRMKVLWLPNSAYTLTWRLLAGLSARSVWQGSSPISERRGERILSEKITFLDDPRHPDEADARPFDDEGVECDRAVFIENGVLQGFYTDLAHAEKLDMEPTGHGWRSAMMGGDPLTLKPGPSLQFPTFEPGDRSRDELIAGMDRGIVLENVLGAHSGNIPNGDYSVGVSSGLYVENGEIAGRVADTMVSGNVWETLSNVVGVENRQVPGHAGRMPAILCDDVSVAGR